MRTRREESGFLAFGKMHSLVQSRAPLERRPSESSWAMTARVYGPSRLGGVEEDGVGDGYITYQRGGILRLNKGMAEMGDGVGWGRFGGQR